MDKNSTTTDWYHMLNKPSWAPPDSAFGIVWSLLYPIIIAVNIYVIIALNRGKIGFLVALPFWLNILFNVIFTPLQFGLRNNTLAMIDIALILITIIWAMGAIWQYNKWITLAFAPYLIWVSIATALQLYITTHN